MVYAVETWEQRAFPGYFVSLEESVSPFCVCLKQLTRARFLQIDGSRYVLFSWKFSVCGSGQTHGSQTFQNVSRLSNHLYFPSLFGRSPWSNKYDPPLEDGAMPSARLRKLEVEANNAFDQYRDLYVSSTLQSPLLAFISFSRTHNESKTCRPAASEHGTPVCSRGRRAGSRRSTAGKRICSDFTIWKPDQICQLMLKADAEVLSCLPPLFNRLLASLSSNNPCSLWSWLSSVLNHLLFPFPQDCTLKISIYIAATLTSSSKMTGAWMLKCSSCVGVNVLLLCSDASFKLFPVKEV